MSLTKIIKIDPEKPDMVLINEAAEVLRSGGLVIMPTETVYGIAANMLDAEAVERLYKIKQRAKDKPFSIHIGSKEQVDDFALNIPVAAYKLIADFWPGPLTLILNSVSGGKVGLRVPDEPSTLKIILASEVPIVMPSANLSDCPAPVTFGEAIKDMRDLVDLAIDAGRTRLGLESTIVDLTFNPLKIVRQGALKQEDINKSAGTKNILFVCTGNSCRSVMAEAYLKKVLEKRNRKDARVYSAGIMLAGSGASETTREVLLGEGIDVSSHRSQRISRELIDKSDLILVMEKIHEEAVVRLDPKVKNRLFLLKEFAKINDGNLNIIDPIGGSEEFYQQTFEVIKQAVERVADII